MTEQEADAAYQHAADDLNQARVRATQARRRGLHYAAVDIARTHYLVTLDGVEIGELHHDREQGGIDGWTALRRGRQVAQCRTGRQAAAALLPDYRPN